MRSLRIIVPFLMVYWNNNAERQYSSILSSFLNIVIGNDSLERAASDLFKYYHALEHYSFRNRT